MRLLNRFRAGTLVAGAGVILAGTMTGCWDPPKRPNSSLGTNIPKTNVNMPGGSGGSTGGMSGSSSNRTTGNPPIFDQSGRPTSGAPTSNNTVKPAAGNNNLLTPLADPNGLQPIATNGAKPAAGIQPANYAGADPSGNPPPLKLPLTDSSAPTGPAVEPISVQNLDAKPKFRSSPPQIPVDSLQPAAPPAPTKPGTLLPPVSN